MTLKAVLFRLYLSLPRWLSWRLYALGRQLLYPDARELGFAGIFTMASARSYWTREPCGDYLEFGTYRGTSFVLAMHEARKHEQLADMRFFAFDSFQGLPHDEGTVCKTGEHACSEQQFLRLCRQAGADLSKVHTIPGFYDVSLTHILKQQYKLRPAIVHIDCDLYTSTKTVLDWLTDLVQPGTFLIFDDWMAFERDERHPTHAEYGEPRAFEEWPLRSCFEPWGKIGDEGYAFRMIHYHPVAI